jgi:hypothetical protein
MRFLSFLLFLLCVLFQSGYAQAELVRLFTTPQDRVAIDYERQQALLNLSSTEQTNVAEGKNNTRIALNAVLIGYKKAIWVNQKLIEQATEINGIMIDPKNATKKGLWITTVSGKKLIKQGQVYLMDSDKVVERYEI